MKQIVLLLLLALLAAPVFAGSKTCNASLVTAGVCRAPVNTVIYFDVIPADLARLVNGLAASVQWTATVACTQAMVDLSQCTVEQLGQQVTNPETKAAAANRALLASVQSASMSGEAEILRKAAMDALAAQLAAITPPDVGN